MESCSVSEKSCRICSFFIECKFFYLKFANTVSRPEYLWYLLEIDKQIYARTKIICTSVKNIFKHKLYVNVLPHTRFSFISSFPEKLQRIIFGRNYEPITKVAQRLWS